MKRAKKAIKKAILTTKKVVKKAKAAVTKAKQQVKAAVKQTKQVVKEKVLPVVKKAAQATTKAVKNAVKPKNLLNTLQVGLDLVGLIPGFGEIADGVNGIIYLARGDKVNAALSFGAMIPFAGWAATGGKLVNKGAGVVKSVAEGVQNVLKGPVGSVVDQVKKQVVNVKTQIQSKVAEVKQQLRQMVQSQQQNFALAGGDVRHIEDTGTVGRNTPTPSPKPSNTQPSQNGSNKKPAEDKGTGQATVVRSTEQSLNRVDQIRQEFNVGSKRNIAFAEYEINGKKGELIGVSGNADRVGTVGVPDKRIFDTITTGNNPRTLDSEVKILEDLSSSLSKDASGKVYLFSELPFCISCAGVIKQFKQRFPNIDVIIDHGPGGK
ncbi:deaminase domain-containing protein [Lysinibacillus sphaericus]|uniref:deaminase domain-containing protein n=2 Tax=Lysinibacillus sphaericus TaxID=1421 RepID=UPI0015D4E528|nr:deaminase domain-containing protein [Lysinibacillus sphaericus]